MTWPTRWGLLGGVALIAAAALGAGGADARGGDDRAATEAILRDLDAAKTAAIEGDVKEARAALERATRMRGAGDDAHARIAEGLAREHAESARDLVRAVDAETTASELRLAAMDAGAQLEREQALLEEAIARTGRLRAELEAADREAKATPDRQAIERHDDDKGPPKEHGTKPKPQAPKLKRPQKSAGGAP
jgi:hypothetical protein